MILVRRSPRISLISLLTAVAATVGACGGDDGTSPTTPSAIALVSADSQTTPVGVPMAEPLVVQVTGRNGTPIPNVDVVWGIGNGGGSLSDTTVKTDASGHAQTTYTPGTVPGVARVTAKAGSVTVFFTMTLVAGPPTALAKFGSDNPATIAGSKLTLSVRLADSYGNPISGGTVNWTADGGTLSAETSTTDEGGVASVDYTVSSTKGTYTLTAVYEGLPPATFTITAL